MYLCYATDCTQAGLGKITDGVPQYAGVVVYSMSDLPLGFGVAAQPTEVILTFPSTFICLALSFAVHSDKYNFYVILFENSTAKTWILDRMLYCISAILASTCVSKMGFSSSRFFVCFYHTRVTDNWLLISRLHVKLIHC